MIIIQIHGYIFDFVNLGIQTVEVDKIIGLDNGRVDEYNDDWTPKTHKIQDSYIEKSWLIIVRKWNPCH